MLNTEASILLGGSVLDVVETSHKRISFDMWNLASD